MYGDAQMIERFKAAMFSRQLKAWEKKRRQGKRSFVLYRGVLRWGGFIFVLTTLTNVMVRHMKLDWVSEISLLIACPFVGYFWARCVWYLNELHFRDAMEQQGTITKSKPGQA
jgi:hypothetical protein